ncbi:MAG: trans-aconitate 2-methyltransferase [Gammaproteobacteria bacterium]|nr:trans-aconitate 2-methyltransferase [Gammaproteobacteria bacterium]
MSTRADTWSASQYRLFEDERNRPIADLLAALPPFAAPNAIDLGCGPGNSSELLLARYPGARLSGIDRSPDMIAAARKRLPAVAFEIGEVESWSAPGPYEVILANAVLHWLPDHERLFPSLAARLPRGGALAVQMPDNLEEPTHRLMREVAARLHPQIARQADATRTTLGTAADYYRWLRASCRRVDVWRTTYHHPLAGGVRGIVEWFKGSALGPYLTPLDASARASFLEAYAEALAPHYAPLADGSVLLPFPRLFIVAVR